MDSHRSLKAICHFHFFFLLCLSHQKLFLHQEKILYRMIDVDDTSLKMLIFFLSFDRYSFDYGSIHFTMMSTEHNFTQGSRQYKWIEQDLKNVNRSLTPWLAIVGHRAMYSSQKEEGKWDKKN